MTDGVETLVRAVNALLAAARMRRRPEFAGEPINWASLRCVSVETRVTMWPKAEAALSPRIVVMVEEASSPKLEAWLVGQLSELGLDAEVETEW